MSNPKRILVMLVVLAALVGGYFAVTHFISEDETKEESITVSDLSDSGITAVSWTDRDNKTSIKLKLAEDGEKWYYPDDEAFPLDQDDAQSVLAAVKTVSSSLLVTDAPEDLGAYGLDEPAYQLDVTLSDGSTVSYLVGDYSNFSSAYYFKLGSSDSVYLVDSTLRDVAVNTLYDIVDTEDFPNADTFNTLTVSSGGQKLYTVNHYSDGKPDFYTSEYKYFVDTDKGEIPLDTAVGSAMASDVSLMSWRSCVNYNATEEELASYGLDKDSMSLYMKYTEKYEVDSGETDDDGKAVMTTQTRDGEITLLLGKRNSEGDCYYAMFSGSKMVCLLSVDDVKDLILDDVASVYALDVCLLDIADVTGVKVTYDGKDYDFTCKTAEAEGEKATGSDDASSVDVEAETTYYLNGEEISSDYYDSFVSGLLALKAQKRLDNDAEASGEAVLTAVITTGDGELTYSMYEYDSDSFLLDFNSETKLVVAKSDVKALSWEYKTEESTAAQETEEAF